MNNKFKTCLIACVLSTAAALPMEVAAAERQKGIVTITADDGLASQQILIDEAKKRNLACELAVTTGNIGQPVADPLWLSFTWEELKIAQQTCAISAHTETHCSLTEDCADPESEILWPKRELEQRLGIKVVGFVAPYGNYNTDILKIIKDAGYTYNAGIWVDNGLPHGMNKIGGTDPFAISRINVGRDENPAEICLLVEEAAVKRLWTVLLFHNISEKTPGGENGVFVTPTKNFQEIMTCITKLRDAGEIEVKTIADALKVAAAKPQS
jgi:hypothetical protein